jgi:hypothetical protein
MTLIGLLIAALLLVGMPTAWALWVTRREISQTDIPRRGVMRVEGDDGNVQRHRYTSHDGESFTLNGERVDIDED